MRIVTPYRVLLVAAFLWGCGTNQLTLLAVVLKAHAMTASSIAGIMSVLTVATMFGALASGPLAARFGTVRTMVAGAAIGLTGTALLIVSVDSVLFSLLISIARGVAAGFLAPAGQMFSQAQSTPADRSRVVATFSAMFLLPGLFAPAFGEYVLGLGEGYLFLFSTVPTIVAVALIALLPRDRQAQAQTDSAGYLYLLRDRRLWLPNLSSMQSGICFAFTWTFLALMLRGMTPVAAFFTPFSIANLATRFIALRYLQRLPPQIVVGLGLSAYLTGIIILATSTTLIAVGLTGCLFGFGNGVTMISSIEWSARIYGGGKRPLALVNTSFLVGSIVAQQMTGAFLAMLGWSGVLYLFATFVLMVLLSVCLQFPALRTEPYAARG